jgi:hypothetical protein
MRTLPSNSRDLSLLLPEWMLCALLQTAHAVNSKCLLGGKGSAGMRLQHRCKSGMDGGLTAAIFISPPHHLRTAEFLSKRWGPPHADCTEPTSASNHFTFSAELTNKRFWSTTGN